MGLFLVCGAAEVHGTPVGPYARKPGQQVFLHTQPPWEKKKKARGPGNNINNIGNAVARGLRSIMLKINRDVKTSTHVCGS